VKKNSAAVILSYFHLPTTILTILILLLAASFLFLRGRGKNYTGMV
jgi:protein tyrosine/serine phosphatase